MPLSKPTTLLRQFTATVYILNEEGQALLIYHKKLKKWLPPGGHLDPNELPNEGACREAKEETGLDIELIPDEHITINRWNAKSFPRPYLCLLEEIPAFGDQPAHQHMDFIYLGRPIGGKLLENPNETNGIRWFSLEELDSLEEDVDLFAETKQTLNKILST